MGQMILMLEVDLTVPKQQSHSHTGNENKSKQAGSQNSHHLLGTAALDQVECAAL